MRREDIDAMLFDLGGVVIQVDFEEALRHWAAAGGIEPTALRGRFRQGEWYERHERGEIDAARYFRSLREELGLALDDAAMASGWSALLLDEIAPTVSLIERLADAVPLYLFSNSNLAHYEVWSRRHARVLSRFRRVFVSHELGVRKPEREAFLRVAAEMGVAPGRILFFDDTAANVEGARAAGLHAVHVKAPSDIAAAVSPWL